MPYRHAVPRENFADFSGGVLHSAPGFPAFPVRLASEMFQRALALSSASTARVWDPCCGSGYLLTTLALMHRTEIAEVFGSDVDQEALALARKNLALLCEGGLPARAEVLRERAERLAKPGYSGTADAADRLARRFAQDGGALPHRVASADVSRPDELRIALSGERPNLVITDVPYGEKTSWVGPDVARGTEGMLVALRDVLNDGTIIAVASRSRFSGTPTGLRRVGSFKIGTRSVRYFRVER